MRTSLATGVRQAGATLRNLAFEHGIPLFLFAVLSVAFSWPTVRDFTTALVSDGGDARHNLWLLWHVRQALLGQEPLMFSSLLYYPLGASLLTHGVGPVVGLFALPFWPWGAEAAHNGAMLVALTLTGYGTYLLARGLRFDSGVALFAGVLLMTSELPLAGLYGHFVKSSLLFLPLSLLTTLHALNLERSRWWTLAAALTLLLTLLHAGWHFVLATLGIAYLAITTWYGATADARRGLLQRGLLLGLASLVLVGPLLVAIWRSTSGMIGDRPPIEVDVNLQSITYRPDLIEFLLPSRHSRLFGSQTRQFLASYNISWTIETMIATARTGIFFALLALLHGAKASRRWLWLVLLCIVFALGPSLKVVGIERFTEYQLPIILPYAFLTALPGFDFMRKSGQIMALGLVAFAISAGFGLTWFVSRLPQYRLIILVLAITLVLVESWPQAWPQEELRQVPSFYRQLAQEDAEYGVFDLPLKPTPDDDYVGYSSHYQMYQLVHRKGIAAGYLSRTYAPHPLFPCLYSFDPIRPDVLVDGEASNCYESAHFQLAHYGYRYVVWHKPREEYPDYQPGSWGEEVARTFVTTALGDQPPVVDDELVRVYALSPADEALPDKAVLMLHSGWHQRETSSRWASSPAVLEIVSPRTQPAVLEITPDLFYDPTANARFGRHGELIVQTDSTVTNVSASAGERVAIPLDLQKGSQRLSIRLDAGNFRPADYGAVDSRLLSFAVRTLELRTQDADTYREGYPVAVGSD